MVLPYWIFHNSYSSTGSEPKPYNLESDEDGNKKVSYLKIGEKLSVTSRKNVSVLNSEGKLTIKATDVSIMNSSGSAILLAEGNVNLMNITGGVYEIKALGNLSLMNIRPEKGAIKIVAEVGGNFKMLNFNPDAKNLTIDIKVKGDFGVDRNISGRAGISIVKTEQKPELSFNNDKAGVLGCIFSGELTQKAKTSFKNLANEAVKKLSFGLVKNDLFK